MAASRRLSLSLLLFFLLPGTQATPQGLVGEEHFPIVYVLYGPEGVPQARAVVKAGRACPALAATPTTPPAALESLEGQRVRVRAEGTDAMPYAFPVRVCEVELPRELPKHSVTFGGRPLPGLSNNSSKFLLIGDTGLRIKPKNLGTCAKFSHEKLYGIKVCEKTVPFNPALVRGAYQAVADWPLESIMDRAASEAPDVAIHVGDYLYRQGPCAKGKGCESINNATNASMPGAWGDNWKGWYADFFKPSATLLAAAPWIALRGNHESCPRGGHGYFLFLDPRPLPANWTDAYCPDRTDAYKVPFASEQFLVLDDNFIEDVDLDKKCPLEGDTTQVRTLPVSRYADPEQKRSHVEIKEEIEYFASQFRLMAELAKSHATNFYLGHHPLLGIACHQRQYVNVDWTLQQALEIAPEVLDLVSATINGHVHWFQGFVFENHQLPVSLVVGNGGTLLDQSRFAQPGSADGLEVFKGVQIQSSQTAAGVFGMSTMRRGADGGYDVQAIQVGNDGREPSELWRVTVPGGRARRLQAGRTPAALSAFI